MAPAHFKEDELYRLVYERNEWPDDNNEPDMEYLNEHYAGRMCHIFYKPHIVLIRPYGSMMFAVEMRVDKLIACNTTPRNDSGDDPSLVCYDEPPTQCD